MLMETALASRPDLAAAVLRAEYHRKDIVYQKALAIPDISLGVKYDRAGGVWDNFFGVGIGVQLPVFNRNKGAIRSARFRLRQNEIWCCRNGIIYGMKLLNAWKITKPFTLFLRRTV